MMQTASVATEPGVIMQPCVKISRKGFHPNNTSIEEGQVIDNGKNIVPVLGGYVLPTPASGTLKQFFNLEGEYIFISDNIPGQTITINVWPKTDLIAEVTNNGFEPEFIHITKGHSIKWQWQQCAVRHTVQEVLYCSKHTRLIAKSQEPPVGTLTGSHRQQFKKPGIYYFRTESSNLNKVHYCAIVVTEVYQEHKINVLDDMFQPSILLVEEGETVWWHWSQTLCKKFHAIFQVKPPCLDYSSEDPFEKAI